ncbi:MAG: metallophosphoesterase [Myxococcales bacterium]|jgi:hypothetical protein
MNGFRTGFVLQLAFEGPVAVVGDIHGCAGALRELLEELGEVPVVVLGDVDDRGAGTRAVIDMLVRRGAAGVRGNHDDWLIAWACGEGFDSFALHPLMGGRETLSSYGVEGTSAASIEAERWRVPREHRAWLESLSDAIDLEVCGERYWLVHGGVPEDQLDVPRSERVPWFAQNAPERLHGYRQPLGRNPELGRPLIVGHQRVESPFVSGSVIALDTGAGERSPGSRLTAIVLPERRLVSVPSWRDVT